MYWLRMPDGKVWFSWLLLALLEYKHADEINKRDLPSLPILRRWAAMDDHKE
jgi:hypothetical protein